MFDLQLRDMFKPDMTGLQVSMYQLTRLLSETSPALYKLLDRLEVDPSLYATPWFLTLFAANFPLGFVSRVIDLVFLDGKAAIIKIGMSLLLHSSNLLLESDSLEEVMTIIKTDLPNLPRESLEDVIRQAASLNVARQLKTYEVEYSVIQEELSLDESGQRDSYETLKTQIIALKKDKEEMLSRIARLENDLTEEKERTRDVRRELAEQRRIQEEKNIEETTLPPGEEEAKMKQMLEIMRSMANLPPELRDFLKKE